MKPFAEILSFVIVLLILADNGSTLRTDKPLAEHALGERYASPNVRKSVAAGWMLLCLIMVICVFQITGAGA